MATSITLPEQLEIQLQKQAIAEQRSVEAVALDLVRAALNVTSAYPTVDDVVAKIKATPPNPYNTRPAKGSLVDALRHAAVNHNFDLDQWDQEWAAVEAELRAMTRRE